MLINCYTCNKQFLVTPHLKHKKYCSWGCYSEFRNQNPAPNFNSILQKCLTCNGKFWVIPAKLKAGKGKFCSKKCYLVDHSRNTWSAGTCLGCKKQFKFRTKRKQICCSLRCNTQWKKVKNKDKKYDTNKCKQCNKEVEVLKSRIKDKRGEFCSRKCYAKWMSINLHDEKAYGWKGGLTSLTKKIRRLKLYKDWQTETKKKGNICCQCGSDKKLEIDHIYPFYKIIKENKIKTVKDAIGCMALWNPKNGRLLCHSCHIKTDSYGFVKVKNMAIIG